MIATSYRDSRISCDALGLEIRWYYFPFGTRRIRWPDIVRVRELELDAGLWDGRWRIWGSSDLRHWFNLDTRRPDKRWAYVLELAGQRVRPVLTPDHPGLFKRCVAAAGRELIPPGQPGARP